MKPMLILLGLTSLLSLDVQGPPAAGGGSCPRDEASYVGAKACKACHLAEFKSWEKTAMAKSFDSLKPGKADEAKKKFNLDPAKDFTKDAGCLACHTTGYGKPGGYPEVGKAWTDEDTKRAAGLEGVQCESCHGPGSLMVPFKKDNKEPKKADLLAKGMIEPTKAVCDTCHNDKNPFFDKSKPFEYEKLIVDPEKVHKRKKAQ